MIFSHRAKTYTWPRRGLIGAAVLWLAVFGLAGVSSGTEVVDRIVAVVGHQIILQSELDAQLEISARQLNFDLSKPGVYDKARTDVLDQMVKDRLMLIQAERDTSISVSDRDVEKELDAHLQRVQSQFPSPEDFYKQLASEGLTLPELRRRYRVEVKNQLLKQKLIENKVQSVEISLPEVDEFFARYQDSLPMQPASIHLADILLDIPLSDRTYDSVRAEGEQLLDSLAAGVKFAQLAMRHSDDPASAPAGGDLGWFGRGVMVPEFEKAAFGLPLGETSGLVQSPFGFHIIKSIERDRARVHVAHILLRTLPTQADIDAAMTRADSVYQALQAGADFGALAKVYSRDSVTASQGGDLGWVPIASLQEPFKSAILGHSGSGLLKPVAADDGIHIIDILDRHEERPYSLEQDRKALTEMARREKTGRVVDDWVEKLRKQIYVEVRL